MIMRPPFTSHELKLVNDTNCSDPMLEMNFKFVEGTGELVHRHIMGGLSREVIDLRHDPSSGR
jgi:hypothetical protein